MIECTNNNDTPQLRRLQCRHHRKIIQPATETQQQQQSAGSKLKIDEQSNKNSNRYVPIRR